MDYGAAAAQLYTPGLQASQANAKLALDTTKQGLQTETNATNADTAASETKVQGIYNTNLDKNAFDYSRALGGQATGLLVNAQTMATKDYADSVASLETARNNKLLDITGRGTLASEKYTTDLGNAQDSYNANVAKYVSDSQAEAAKEQAAANLETQREQAALERTIYSESAASSRAAASAAAKEPSARDNQSAFNQDLTAAFQAVSSGKVGYHPFVREQVAQALADQYGLSIPEAQKQVNSVFTDSWDQQMQKQAGLIKAPAPKSGKILGIF